MTRRKTETTILDEEREEEQHREYLLAMLRASSLRAKTWDADLTAIGVALKGGMIGTDTAVQWIRDAGLLWMVPIPEQVGRIAKTNAAPEVVVEQS